MSFVAAGSKPVLYQWLHPKLDTAERCLLNHFQETASHEIIVLHVPYNYIFNNFNRKNVSEQRQIKQERTVRSFVALCARMMTKYAHYLGSQRH